MKVDASSRAVESLLSDSDEHTRRVVFEELLADYDKHKVLIEQLTRSDCSRVRRVARHLKELSASGHCECLLHGSEDWALNADWETLEGFCWELARFRHPSFKVCHGRQFIDQLAFLVNEKLTELADGPVTAEQRVKAIRHVVHRRYGFTGNRCDYYNPDNSYLNRVLESRKGIPVSLTLLVILIGRRLDWPVQGLHLPGHFLAAVDSVAFDPFHDGVVVSPRELSDRYMLPESEFVDLSSYHATPFLVAQRMLGNLLHAYSRNGNREAYERIEAYWQSMQDAV